MKNIIIDGVEYNLTQVKKEYEILSFKGNSKTPKQGIAYKSKVNGLFTMSDENNIGASSEEVMLQSGWDMYSVKRLSDGKIFTVGDKVNWVTDFIIKGFTLNGNHCYADVININSLSLISPPLFKTEDGQYVYKNDLVFETIDDERYFKVSSTKNSIMTGKNSRKYFSTKEAAQKYIDSKKILFRTEDGVDIYEGDEYHSILINSLEYKGKYKAETTNCGKFTNPDSCKTFSTKEAAEEFILWNKPSLSLKQIEDTVNLHWQDLEKLKEVIK